MATETTFVAEALKLIQQGGLPFVVLLILYGGYKQIWVWGRELRDARAEAALRLAEAEERSDEWKALALRSAGLVDRATSAVVSSLTTTSRS